jgi:hypothetical protein
VIGVDREAVAEQIEQSRSQRGFVASDEREQRRVFAQANQRAAKQPADGALLLVAALGLDFLKECAAHSGLTSRR